MKICIALMSFNRPDYFELCLQGLAGQTLLYNTYLFQDNCINIASHIPRGRPENIQRCRELFRCFCPEGIECFSTFNLGCTLNYERAFVELFDKEKYDWVIFIEDDVVLNSYCIEELSCLMSLFQNNPHVGLLSVVGAWPNLAYDRQQDLRHELVPLSLGWFVSCAISRGSWEGFRDFFLGYSDITRGTDYCDLAKCATKLAAYYCEKGARCREGDLMLSPDRACEVGMLLDQRIFLSTLTNNARYVGEYGAHGTPEIFRMMGCDKTVLYDKAETVFQIPNEDVLLAYVEERKRQWLVQG